MQNIFAQVCVECILAIQYGVKTLLLSEEMHNEGLKPDWVLRLQEPVLLRIFRCTFGKFTLSGHLVSLVGLGVASMRHLPVPTSVGRATATAAIAPSASRLPYPHPVRLNFVHAGTPVASYGTGLLR